MGTRPVPATREGAVPSRELPYFIRSDECDVPRKQRFKKLQFSSSLEEWDLPPPSRPFFSSQKSLLDVDDEELHLSYTPRFLASADTHLPPTRRSLASSDTHLPPTRRSLASSDTHLPPTRRTLASSDTHLPRTRRSLASSDTEVPPRGHFVSRDSREGSTRPAFSTNGKLPLLHREDKDHLDVPTKLPFSYSYEYFRSSVSRSASVPSLLHDYDDAEDVGVMATLGAQYHSSGSSSMASNNGVSRLAMMQARLREQLMVEKESRLLQMAARQEAEREGTIQRVTKSSASTLSSSLSSLSSSLNSSGGQGRVRKLFEERRTNGYGHSPVGRDKSYPLEPVRGGSTGSTGGGRPPVKPVKGVIRNRGVSVDRGKNNYDPEMMRRSRSHAALQQNANNNNEPRSPARGLRPPQTRPPVHHKSTPSLLDANQNYNGRGTTGSLGPSRDASPAPSPSHNNANRFGFRGTPSRGPSPAPSMNGSPARGPQASPRRTNTFNHRQHEEVDGGRSPVPPSQPPRQRPAQPPPRKPPARQPPPRRQPSPPADNDNSAFFSPRPLANPKSKPAVRGVPPITRVSEANSPPISQSKPKPPPKPKTTPATPARSSKPPPGLSSCKVCGRNFATDRLEKHETICAKSKAKSKKRKNKVFDPVKMRTKGTEAEKYISRGKHLEELPKPKKKDWKKQHEDFIATIRAAKTGAEPPPTDNSDYIQCPHCGRKFAEAAADRHIPKCASIQSNKPAAGRRR
ncbi:atrophin-1-like isoform X3 [Homarus americanus]|uniref:atrophin-1-like isoform X3 n=1 Tax=Homarus americanus TaxID=6706 RepID=UPI001C4504A1|nr:atrophin-1-like isoform X3 [Homarus americanus]